MGRCKLVRGILDIYSLHLFVKIALSVSIIRKLSGNNLELYLSYLLSIVILRSSKWLYILPKILGTHDHINTSYLQKLFVSNFNFNVSGFFNILRSINNFNHVLKKYGKSIFLGSIDNETYSLNCKKQFDSNLDILLSNFHEILYLRKKPIIEYLLLGENLVELFSNISDLPHPQNATYLRQFIRDIFCLFSFENINFRTYVFDLFKRLARTSDYSGILFFENSFCSLTHLSILSSKENYVNSSQLYLFFLASDLVELCEQCFPFNITYKIDIQMLVHPITLNYNDYIYSNNPALFLPLYKIKISSLALNTYV